MDDYDFLREETTVFTFHPQSLWLYFQLLLSYWLSIFTLFGAPNPWTDFGDGGTNLYQISRNDSPIIYAEPVYFQVPKNCTVLKQWPSNRFG